MRKGLTILEVLVSMAILAIIGTVVLSNTNPESDNDTVRIQAVAVKLADLREAIAGFKPTQTAASFRQTVGVLPSRLSHLTTPITVAQTNSCGVVYTAAQVTNWQNPAVVSPYFAFEMKAAGTPLGQGFTPQDLLIKTPVGVPPAGNQAGTLTIRFPSVEIDDANALELIVDGTVNTTAGHVQFTPAGTAPVQLDYVMSVYGC